MKFPKFKNRKMKNLTLSEKTARAMYGTANSEVKQILEETFGKEFFNMKITDRVKTFEDALAIAGMPTCKVRQALIEYKGEDEDTLSAQAAEKIAIIACALNEGWKPEMHNTNQYKYWPYFDLMGAAFSYDDYDCADWTAHVGSRLVYKSAELAEYAGKQFTDIYKVYHKVK